MKQVLVTLGVVFGLVVILISTILEELYFNFIVWIAAGVGIVLTSVSLYIYSFNRETRRLRRQAKMVLGRKILRKI